MSKVIENYLANVSNVATLGTSPLIEVFRVAGRAVGAGTTSPNLTIAPSMYIADGDQLYVGISDSTAAAPSGNVATVSSGGGTTSIVLNGPHSWADNAAIIIKRTAVDAGAGNGDSYATVYNDEDFQTAVVGGQPITADGDNEWGFYVPPGLYGIRISDSTGRTFQLDQDVSLGVSRYVNVTPSYDSPTAGIIEAIAKLPVSGGVRRGVVYMPPGDYPTTANIALTGPVVLRGPGSSACTISVGADVTGITCTRVSASANEFPGLEGFSIRPTVINSNYMIHLNQVSKYRLVDVEVDANDLANTGDGIFVDRCVAVRMEGVSVGDWTPSPVGSFVRGVHIEFSDNVLLSNCALKDVTHGVDIVDSGGNSSGVVLLACDWNNVTNAIRANVGIGAKSLHVSGGAYGSVTNRLVFVGSQAEATQIIYQGHPDNQSTYFDSLFIQPWSVQAMAAAGTALTPLHRNILLLTSDADYTLSATPTIAAGENGQELLIFNLDVFDAVQNTITLQDNATLVGSTLYLKTTTLALGPRDSVRLRYVDSQVGWVEIERNARTANGTATIATGNTSITVTHGMLHTPIAADVTVTPTNSPANPLTTGIWVDTITATQFNINRNDPGGDATFSWRVELD